jgi:preprotein translocase subunit SecB
MNQPAQQPDDATQAPPQPSFQVEKLYVKDLSLEVPNAPQVFMQPAQPELEIQVSNGAAQIGDGLFEVVVTVTVTARAADKTMFLVEAAQAGIFSVRGVSQDDLDPLLGIGCPTILFPYVREAVSDLVTRAGFPPVLLAPVSFEQIYLQRRQQGAQPQVQPAH